ncbi:MAG: sulfatase-like hydrolase/transferase [Clostridiaceae bacterium]|nr:sulfatase-like hydrolase/transferase [Clostridiaceae bacterium]
MKGSVLSKIRFWISDLFETRKDIVAALSVLFFILTAILKIAVFNHMLVPNADKWMFRYKVLITGLIVLMTYPILFRFRKRTLLIVFYIAQVLYIVINMSYYLYFHNYLHVEQFISNFFEGATAVLNASSPNNPVLLTAVADLPFFISLLVLYPRVNRLRIKLKVPAAAVIILSLLITAIAQYGHYKDNVFITHIANSLRYGESFIVQRYGTLANSIVSISKIGNEQQLIESFRYGPERTNEKTESNNPDIFIVQVESLESEIINKKHNGSYIMPFMNSLTRESVYYPYMVSYHFYGGTSDCEFSAINTVEPLTYYTSIKLISYDYPNSFVKQLKNGPYKAYAFHGNIGRYYNRDIAFKSFGFDEFFDIAGMDMKDVGWGAPDDQVLDFSLNVLKDAGAPVLSYVITMSSHGPFTNVSYYYDDPAFSSIEDKKLRGCYNSMAYVDRTLKEYVTKIRENYDNAYIIIYGDHTPQIGNEAYKEAFTIIGDYRYEFVPLFIITPDGKKYREGKQAASLIDVAPTVLNISGVEYSIRTDGKDLLDFDEKAGTIPFRGLEWDRAELLGRITEALETE